MATLISAATGDFTAAGTWKVASAVANAEVDSEASSINLTTSNSDSTAFTLAATNVDAIAIKISAIITPTGTLTAILRNSTTGTDVATVTINASDLHGTGTTAQGWHVFSFSAHTPNGTDSYLIRLTRSVADGASNRITIYASTAAAANMARMVRLVTTAAPAAGDKLVIAGQFTGAGTSAPFTVTMNNTATTSFGPTVSGGPPQGITVNDKGTLTWGTAAATNYYLKWKGVLKVFAGGTLNVGTSGTPIPANSSAVLEMDSVANVDTGLDAGPGSTVNMYGAIRHPVATITGASNATPIEITTASHGLVAGQRLTITGVLGNTAANGNWEVIASTGANTFTIGAINGGTAGTVGTSTGNGAYTSGGTWQRIGYTRLTADAAAGATTLTMYSTEAMRAGDEVCIASTTRTSTQCEKRTILTVDSATQVTLTAALTFAHSGTAPTQAEVATLTRNVKVRGISTSLQGYVLIQTTGTFVASNVEFLQLGSATANKRGIDITTTTGSCTFSYCTVHDGIVTNSTGINVTGAASNNVTISNTVVYNTNINLLVIAATTGTWTVSGNLLMLNVAAGNHGVILSDVGSVFKDNTVAGSAGIGISLAEAAAIGTFSGNTSHSNASIGISLSVALTGGTISNSNSWRNGGSGLRTSTLACNVTFDMFLAMGNLATNIELHNGGGITFRNGTAAGDSTFSTVNGVLAVSTTVVADAVFENCTFGDVSGIRTAHTQDFNWVANGYGTITCRNCLFASSTELTGQTTMAPGSYLASQKHDQVAGSHKTWYRTGTISIDTAIYGAASPSQRLTPSSAPEKLESGTGVKLFVASGQTATVSVKVRESVAGDGTDYNGNRPRLIVKKNVAAGIAADTVLATATVACEGGDGEVLTGTTPAVTDNAVLTCVVDCDGTTGWVNVDDWST